MERLLTAPGPTGGFAAKPSDEDYPESALFVLDDLIQTELVYDPVADGIDSGGFPLALDESIEQALLEIDVSILTPAEQMVFSDEQDLLQQIRPGIDGLIIDLRGNGGGHLTEATALSGLFIDNGPVVQLRNTNGRIQRLDDPRRLGSSPIGQKHLEASTTSSRRPARRRRGTRGPPAIGCGQESQPAPS